MSFRRILGISGMGLLFDSFDVGLLSFVLVSIGKEWNLSAGTLGYLGSIGFVGMALGSALAGLLADRFGRKQVFMWTLLIYSIATGLTAAATGIGIFIILRFLVGFGLGGELPVATTYISESSPDAVRGRRVIFLESFWAIGSLIAALVSRFVIPSIGWRYTFLIGALPALYVFVLRRTLPESPKFERVENKRSIGSALRTLWSRNVIRGTIVTWITWFIMNFVYYGTFFWLPTVMYDKGYSLVHSLTYVLVVTIFQLPGYLIAAWLVEKWGRKWTLGVAMFMAALASLGFGYAQSDAWILIFGMASSFTMLAAFGSTYVFTVEQFPTQARASGIGWAAGFGRIGSILAPSIVGSLIAGKTAFSSIFLTFFIIMLIGCFVVLIFGRETKNRAID